VGVGLSVGVGVNFCYSFVVNEGAKV
jgi:hypothetical protein